MGANLLDLFPMYFIPPVAVRRGELFEGLNQLAAQVEFDQTPYFSCIKACTQQTI